MKADAVILGLILLAAGPAPAGSSGGDAPAAEKVVFVFRGVDQKRGVAVLRPAIAVDLGVQLDSGETKVLPAGEVLRCEEKLRSRKAMVDGEAAEVTELLLDCGKRVFAVKGLIFVRGS